MKICADCGRARPDVKAGAHRAIRCDACRLAFERARNRRRPWYAGPWPRIRREAKRNQRVCQRCGSGEGLEVDHIAPRSVNGGLQVLCRACHQEKGR